MIGGLRCAGDGCRRQHTVGKEIRVRAVVGQHQVEPLWCWFVESHGKLQGRTVAVVAAIEIDDPAGIGLQKRGARFVPSNRVAKTQCTGQRHAPASSIPVGVVSRGIERATGTLLDDARPLRAGITGARQVIRVPSARVNPGFGGKRCSDRQAWAAMGNDHIDAGVVVVGPSIEGNGGISIASYTRNPAGEKGQITAVAAVRRVKIIWIIKEAIAVRPQGAEVGCHVGRRRGNGFVQGPIPNRVQIRDGLKVAPLSPGHRAGCQRQKRGRQGDGCNCLYSHRS